MQILILKQFLSKIINLSQKNNENINFESIFMKHHKFESKNYENFHFESIFIKNHENHENFMPRRSASQRVAD